jgi:hypothetical protein
LPLEASGGIRVSPTTESDMPQVKVVVTDVNGNVLDNFRVEPVRNDADSRNVTKEVLANAIRDHIERKFEVIEEDE